MGMPQNPRPHAGQEHGIAFDKQRVEGESSLKLITEMTGQNRVKQEHMSDEPMRSRKRPEWAAGLRQLYDSVVEEPLPDSFGDLLSRFDDNDRDDSGGKDDPKASSSKAPQGGKGA